jgi:glutathione S-transferase
VSLVLYQHPFAMYCWKPLIALYERDLPFASELVEADRSALAALWPPASIPVLVDDGVVVPESSIIVEHLDRRGDAAPLIPTEPNDALQARLWDRVADGYLTTPAQSIVADALRPPDAKDPHGVSEAHAALDLAYATLDRQLSGRD